MSAQHTLHTADLNRDASLQVLSTPAWHCFTCELVHHRLRLDKRLRFLSRSDLSLTPVHCRAWREAVRVAYEHARDDLVDTIVAPAAAEAAASMLQDARDSCERLVKYSSRLTEVRRQKSAMAAAVEAAGEARVLGHHYEVVMCGMRLFFGTVRVERPSKHQGINQMSREAAIFVKHKFTVGVWLGTLCQ